MPTKLTGTSDGLSVTWDITPTWQNSDKNYFQAETTGLHFGSKSCGIKCLKLNTTDLPGNISKISVKANSNGSAKLSVSVGGTAFLYSDKENVTLTSTATTYDFVGLSEGEIIINFTDNADAKNIYLVGISINYIDDGTPSYPTVCEAPTFKINDIEVTETSETVYAGTKISVSCATPKATTVWTVNETAIDDLEYTIPATAKAGDVYSFRAQSHVQGESAVITSKTTDLKVTIGELPLEGYFYTPSVTNAPVYGTELNNKSGVNGGNNNTAAKALCAVEGGFNSGLANITFSNQDGSNFAYINSSKNISIYNGNTFTISVAEGYYITSIEMDKTKDGLTADGGEFSNGNWNNKEGETKSTVKFTYNGSSNWTSACISTIKVKYALLPVVEPVAPAIPDLHESSKGMLSGNTISGEGTANIKFADVESHINLYYKFIDNTQASEPVALAATEHNHDGYNLYDKENGLNLGTEHDGKTLKVFACDSNTGKHSEPAQYKISMLTVGVAEIEAAGAGEIRWFDMQGREVKGQPEKGIYVRVVNGKASKVIL